jgi:hypothetical protein
MKGQAEAGPTCEGRQRCAGGEVLYEGAHG